MFTSFSSASGVTWSLPQPSKRVEARWRWNYIAYRNRCDAQATKTRYSRRPFRSSLINGIEQGSGLFPFQCAMGTFIIASSETTNALRWILRQHLALHGFVEEPSYHYPHPRGCGLSIRFTQARTIDHQIVAGEGLERQAAISHPEVAPTGQSLVPKARP